MGLTVERVVNKKDLTEFINFPFLIYSGNQYWCPPMRTNDRETLRKDKNPAFEYCESEYWLARRDGRTVGRIAGIINRKIRFSPGSFQSMANRGR